MDSVVEKLSEIESAAVAIVEHAETQKFVIEKEIQSRRDQFDKDLEKDTQKQLDSIRREASDRMNQILDVQRKKNQSTIDSLRQEFESNHTAYAQEILKHITEV